MRLFVAVQFSPAVRDTIEHAIERFPVADPPWRWARPDTWHITLKFIGDTAPDDVAAMEAALAGAAHRHHAFDLSLGAFGAFPNVRRPRVLFYSVSRGEEALGVLAADVDAALAGACGVALDQKPFRAHATVARVKKRPDPPVIAKLRSVPGLEGADQRVISFDLVRSHLGPSGARYETLKQFALPEKP